MTPSKKDVIQKDDKNQTTQELLGQRQRGKEVKCKRRPYSIYVREGPPL